jgi:hypothetical protein
VAGRAASAAAGTAAGGAAAGRPGPWLWVPAVAVVWASRPVLLLLVQLLAQEVPKVGLQVGSSAATQATANEVCATWNKRGSCSHGGEGASQPQDSQSNSPPCQSWRSSGRRLAGACRRVLRSGTAPWVAPLLRWRRCCCCPKRSPWAPGLPLRRDSLPVGPPQAAALLLGRVGGGPLGHAQGNSCARGQAPPHARPAAAPSPQSEWGPGLQLPRTPGPSPAPLQPGKGSARQQTAPWESTLCLVCVR